jgi:hypothetical protein
LKLADAVPLKPAIAPTIANDATTTPTRRIVRVWTRGSLRFMSCLRPFG